MAVQARRLSHDFPAAMGGSLFLDDYARCAPRDTTVLDLACNYGFVPRKRQRLTAAECFVDGQGAGTSPAGLVTVPSGVDVPSRAAGTGAASTSGRVVNGASASQGLVSWMYRLGVEIDVVVRLEVRTCAY